MITYRFLSQYVCVGTLFQPRTVVELSDDATVLSLVPIDGLSVEPANTLYRNGLISGDLLDDAPAFQAGNDVLTYMAAYTKPIRVGEKNNLRWWKKIDFAGGRFTLETTSEQLFKPFGA